MRDSAYAPVLTAIQAKVIEKYGRADERPSRHKQLYQEMRIGKDEWSRKFRGETKFSYDEIDWLRRHFDAPAGWPFISLEYADALRNANELLRQTVKAHAPPEGSHEPPPAPAASSGHPERQRRGGRK